MSNLEVKQENGLAIFNSPEFGSIRVFMRGDEPWFVAADLCAVLQHSNNREAVSRLDDDEKITVNNPDGNPRAGIPLTFTLVSEAGMYELILTSRLPKAKEFKRWVKHDVLPAIRKTGSYSMQPALPNFANPAEAARAWADEYEKRVAAQKVIEEQAQTIEAQEIALGDNRDWKAVTAIPWLKDVFVDTSAKACSRIGKTLSALSRRMGMEIRKAEDDRWGTVNVYHITVINYFKQRLDTDSNILCDIRK